jgi:nucleoside-diphosphate-sugar epimerase
LTISTEYLKADLDWIYSKSHNLLYEFRGAKILIVGASGFIGSWLLLFFRFLQTNHGFNCKITAIRYSKSTHIIEELNGQEICWIYGDIGELKLQDNNFTHIFFCATPSQLRTGIKNYQVYC